MKKYILAIAILITGCSASRVPDIENKAPAIFAKSGFTIIMKEGWQYGYFETYGGKVWYLLEKDNIRYHAYVTRWGDDDYQIYSLSAVDAIKP